MKLAFCNRQPTNGKKKTLTTQPAYLQLSSTGTNGVTCQNFGYYEMGVNNAVCTNCGNEKDISFSIFPKNKQKIAELFFHANHVASERAAKAYKKTKKKFLSRE